MTDNSHVSRTFSILFPSSRTSNLNVLGRQSDSPRRGDRAPQTANLKAENQPVVKMDQ